MGASYLIWWLDLAPGTAGNYGTLLPPQAGGAAAAGELKGKWVLVQFDGGACDAGCERKLYFMRQVRRAQGKEMPRVARLWLVTDAVAPRAELLAAIEGTVVAARTGRPWTFPAERSGVRPHLPGRSARQPDDALPARPGPVARDQGPAAPAAGVQLWLRPA